MTLHVVTITPNHVLSVSDRMISTSGGLVELDDDRFKHVTLLTDDARAVISFAGFAGKLGRDGKANETTADWLTGVLRDTLEAGYHGIDRHLNDIRDRANQYISSLRTRHQSWDLRLAILVSGWVGSDAFNCIMDNYIKPRWESEEYARDSFTVRIRKYNRDKFKHDIPVAFLGNCRPALRQRALIRLLKLRARREDVEAMFDSSVSIIRAASAISNGAIGEKCSGIYISRNDSGFRALYDRIDPAIWTVIPNHVTSTSQLKMVHWNDEVHRPKPAARLTYLVTPVDADTPRKRLAFWHRALERLRLLHNEYGAIARDGKSKTILNLFHEWQRDHFNPVIDAAHNELNQVILQLQWEDPDSYGRGGQMADPIYTPKMKDCLDTTWDNAIDLGDVAPFEDGR